MNLELTGRRFLVSILGPESGAYPQGIRLSTRERFDAWPISKGDTGHRRGNTLVFERRRAPSIDLSSAVTSMREPPPAIDPRDASWWEAWRDSAASLEALSEEKATELRLASLLGSSSPRTPLGARFADAAGALTRAIGAGRVDAADDAAARLIGLGTGLTPSGDDFLCGLLAALWCTSDDDDVMRRLLLEWGSLLSRRLESTNIISATFLECAIAGCFSGALSEFALAFHGCRAEDAAARTRVALRELCALGHCSGIDTATGFLFGLSFRTDEEMRRYAA
jgi:hypothetical protein